MIRNPAVTSLLLLTGSWALAQLVARESGDSPGDDSEKLRRLFAEDWQWRLEQFPELATYLGEKQYNNRLTDLSFDAILRRKRHEREMLDRIQAIDRSRLSGQDLVSYDLFLHEKQVEVEGQQFQIELMPITQMQGPQVEFPHLIAIAPYQSVNDYENYISRLNLFSINVDQTIALMNRGIEAGWVQAAIPLRAVPKQIEGQLVDDPSKSPLYQPIDSFPSGLTEANRRRLAAAARQAIEGSVMPALGKLHRFIKDTYLPACRDQVSISSFPDGSGFYEYSIRRLTTTQMTSAEIHDLGNREIARIRIDMDEIAAASGYKGRFEDFVEFLRTDPQFYYTDAEELLSGYRNIAKRADAELPRFFADLPRNPYGVYKIPDYEAPAQTTAYYQPGAADGTRAGRFLVNTHRLETRPKYEMEALTLHEAVPGHHLQISRAQELDGLPDFRRNAVYMAYVEGWGLYAESLGREMGFYTDTYSKFGQLTYEMWRACRLVVDTGLHAFNWSRQQAINFMKANTAKTENDITVEVDRYIVWPAQALAYKIGQLKIKELRARAERELKERFDIRKFHNALLDYGPLSLDILEERIGAWIAEQRGTAS